MIYLSGSLAVQRIGERKDVGLMATYRGKRDGGNHARPQQLHKIVWAADNGCFTNPDLNVDSYLAWLEKMTPHQETCLFATAPDVVGDSEATWERSKDVLPRIRELGFAAAYVAQDGIDKQHVPWDSFDCLFIGGTTDWKLSDNTHWLCREAVQQGKWVHMGRVNSMRRMLKARFAGCHSTDGTLLAFGPDVRYAQLCGWLDMINAQPVLNF